MIDHTQNRWGQGWPEEKKQNITIQGWPSGGGIAGYCVSSLKGLNMKSPPPIFMDTDMYISPDRLILPNIGSCYISSVGLRSRLWWMQISEHCLD